MDPKTGAVFTNTRVYSDLTHLEPAPAPSISGGAAASRTQLSQLSSPTFDTDLAPATHSSSSAASMGYDALADALNEQYSTSLPASDFSDFGSGSSMEWMKVCQRCLFCSRRFQI